MQTTDNLPVVDKPLKLNLRRINGERGQYSRDPIRPPPHSDMPERLKTIFAWVGAVAAVVALLAIPFGAGSWFTSWGYNLEGVDRRLGEISDKIGTRASQLSVNQAIRSIHVLDSHVHTLAALHKNELPAGLTPIGSLIPWGPHALYQTIPASTVRRMDHQVVFTAGGLFSALSPEAGEVLYADDRNVKLALQNPRQVVYMTGLHSVDVQPGDVVRQAEKLGEFRARDPKTGSVTLALFQDDKDYKPVELYEPFGRITSAEAIYNVHCLPCHANKTTEWRVGPSLKGLSQRKLKRTGELPTPDELLHGLNTAYDRIPNVPPFHHLFSQGEKKVLVDYLMTL